ncbi:MAG: glycerophosphodiester phosphodiesterase [Actinomycetota bacterium]|nr:glycerophosphodiester phosphodiesterase [Actinomycetota bacterium]
MELALAGPALADPHRRTARSTRPSPPARDRPLVIAHRGASGYRPEHTLASYRLAIRMGADYVEPDLVSTSDGVLVARHENEISGTTDVASHPELADRRTTKTIDGREVTGWFTEDLTLAELRTLRAVERLPGVRPDNTRYDGRYRVPTFDEVLDLVERESRRRGEVIGVYPETKHPTHFDSVGLSLDEPLAGALRRHGLDRPNARVFVQSFETTNLRRLAATVRVPLVQLVARSGAPYDLVAAGDPRTYDDLLTPVGLREISTYADAIGPDKDRVIPRDADGYRTEPTSLVDDAHGAGLRVHTYTFRDECRFLPADCREGSDPDAMGAALREYAAFFDVGVDGVFTDFADTALRARGSWLRERAATPPMPVTSVVHRDGHNSPSRACGR